MYATPAGSFYDHMQASRPTAPLPPEKEVAYAERPRLVSVTCQLAPQSREREGFTCTISKEALLALPTLRAGSYVNLVVPTSPAGDWYLDATPRPGDGYKIPAGRAHFRLRPMSLKRFGFGAVRKGTPTRCLRFLLGEEVSPGYYHLRRVPEAASGAAEASRRAGHLPEASQPTNEARKERHRIAKRAARALLRGQVAAGVPQAVQRHQAETTKQLARQRQRRAQSKASA